MIFIHLNRLLRDSILSIHILCYRITHPQFEAQKNRSDKQNEANKIIKDGNIYYSKCIVFISFEELRSNCKVKSFTPLFHRSIGARLQSYCYRLLIHVHNKLALVDDSRILVQRMDVPAERSLGIIRINLHELEQEMVQFPSRSLL